MSDIIRKIEASMTGKRSVEDLPPLLMVDSRSEKPVHNPYLTEYFVGVKLGHEIRVNDDEPNQKEQAIHHIKKGITELLYGEFRTALRRAQYSLYDRNFEESRKALEEIERKMFYDN